MQKPTASLNKDRHTKHNSYCTGIVMWIRLRNSDFLHTWTFSHHGISLLSKNYTCLSAVALTFSLSLFKSRIALSLSLASLLFNNLSSMYSLWSMILWRSAVQAGPDSCIVWSTLGLLVEAQAESDDCWKWWASQIVRLLGQNGQKCERGMLQLSETVEMSLS